MILGKSLNHDLLSAGWSQSREGALLFDGQEEKHLPGVHEATLLSFLYFTFCISCLVISVRQLDPAELRKELTEGPVKSGPDTNSPSVSLPEKGEGMAAGIYCSHSFLVGFKRASQGNNAAISLP